MKLQQLVKTNETILHMLRIYHLIILYVVNFLHVYLTEYDSHNNAIHNLLETAVVNDTYRTLAQNLLSDHPICTQPPAHVPDRVQWP